MPTKPVRKPLPPVYAEIATLLGGEAVMERRASAVPGQQHWVVQTLGAHRSSACVSVTAPKARVEQALYEALEARARNRLKHAEVLVIEQREYLARTEALIVSLQAALGSLP